MTFSADFRKLSSLIVIVVLAGALLANIAMTQPKAAATELNWKPATLLNGWTNYFDPSFDIGDPQFAFDPATSMIYFRGGISGVGATSMVLFRLPPAYRPTRRVFVSTTLVNATTGRLNIGKDGYVEVEATSGDANAKNFTSLEGIVFPR